MSETRDPQELLGRARAWAAEDPDPQTRAELEDRFAGTATFLGRVDDAGLADLYSRCLALIQPNVEEFGITAVEAQAAGRPVLGVSAGAPH